MTEKNEIRIAKWLNNKGYDIDLTDQLWMEEYEWGEHKTRDIIELMDEYHNDQLLLLSVGKSLKEKEEKPSAKYTNDIDKNYW